MVISSFRRFLNCFDPAKRNSPRRQSLRFRPRCEPLEGRLAPAVINWTGAHSAVDKNWSDGLNWQGGVAPGAGDIANFSSSGTQSFTSNVDTTFTVAGITIDTFPNWGISGGTINVNASLSVTGNFTMGSGTFGGNGAASIGGSGSSVTGGVITLGTGGFTNNGTLAMSTGNTVGLQGTGTLTNNGTINQGPDDLGTMATTTINNAGTFDFIADATIGDRGTVINTGTLEKTGGTGRSSVNCALNNNGGTIDAESGTLLIGGLSFGGTIDGGALDAGMGGSSTAVLELSSSGFTALTYTGSITGSGSGTVALNGATITIPSAGATFNFAGKLFQWTGGTIDVSAGSLTNNGTINLSTTTSVTLTGANSLINNKSILQTGAGTLSLNNNATLDNTSKGTYHLEADGGIGQSGGGTFLNAGTLEKSKGTGTSMISPTMLSNTGTVEAATGTLDIAAAVTQASGSTLTAGTWTVKGSPAGHATLDITSAGSFTTIGSAAKVTLSGPDSSFTNLSGLTTIAKGGSFTLAGNQSFSTAGALTNDGSLTLGPGSVLTVNGSFTEAATGKLTLQMGAVSGTTEVGTIVSTTGMVSLGGSLSVTSTAIPAVGSSFTIVDNEGNSAISGNFTGLTEGATFTVKKGATTMTFQITYAGNDGDGTHNVVITRIA
jgi:hypothetical protein